MALTWSSVPLPWNQSLHWSWHWPKAGPADTNSPRENTMARRSMFQLPLHTRQSGAGRIPVRVGARKDSRSSRSRTSQCLPYARGMPIGGIGMALSGSARQGAPRAGGNALGRKLARPIQSAVSVRGWEDETKDGRRNISMNDGIPSTIPDAETIIHQESRTSRQNVRKSNSQNSGSDARRYR